MIKIINLVTRSVLLKELSKYNLVILRLLSLKRVNLSIFTRFK